MNLYSCFHLDFLLLCGAGRNWDKIHAVYVNRPKQVLLVSLWGLKRADTVGLSGLYRFTLAAVTQVYLLTTLSGEGHAPCSSETVQTSLAGITYSHDLEAQSWLKTVLWGCRGKLQVITPKTNRIYIWHEHIYAHTHTHTYTPSHTPMYSSKTLFRYGHKQFLPLGCPQWWRDTKACSAKRATTATPALSGDKASLYLSRFPLYFIL